MTETGQIEKHGFQTEVTKLLQLMIHSLYSNKEIFLRELISNAADAADKLRFKALSNNALYEDEGELRTHISIDNKAKTITIDDNGIGMTRNEIIEHLGTIARSGTASFFEQLSGDQAKDSQLIGQFGVGFYSSFIVADKVTVTSRAAGINADQGVVWESKGVGGYTVASITKAARGTTVTLHLKKDAHDFLDDWRLRQIINKYSDHINIPVELWKAPTPESKGADSKQIAAEPGKWEKINKATALWTLSKADIKDEEYQEFYKHIAHDFENPIAWSHSHVEGKQEYTSLLYIPAKAPWDLWNREKQRGLKLYVQRVFIMDDAEQFMPLYLRFIKGVLDSNDLPLNISREILQSSKQIDTLRNACVKRVLSMLDKMIKNDSEKYQQFWDQFGNVLKEGIVEDFTNKEKIAGLLRFTSTNTDSPIQSNSLADYVQRMLKEQKKIYYITADSYAAAVNSSYLEMFRKKGIEVLLMTDKIDEWLITHLTDFDGKQLISVTKGDLDLGDLEDKTIKEQQKKAESEYASFLKRAKECLGDKVKEVRLSHRLTETPSCVVTDADSMSSQMRHLMQSTGQSIPEPKYTLELNLEHELVKRVADEADEQLFTDWLHFLLEQAMLAERGSLKDPGTFIKRLNAILQRSA